MRRALIWAALAAALAVPLAEAANSDLLQWRSTIYISASFTGIAAMGLLLAQPLLALGVLPGLGPARTRRLHRTTGAALISLIALHVGALWLTSPPDVIDALTFTSPTPFSVWGVLAMWAALAAAAVAAARRALPRRAWRYAHLSCAVAIAAGTAAHALLIDGTLSDITKIALAVLTVAAALWAAWRVILGRARPASGTRTFRAGRAE